MRSPHDLPLHDHDVGRRRIDRAIIVDPFELEPAVQSAVIVAEPFASDDRLDPAAEDELWRLVQAAFRERRKMLHNVLARQLPNH